MRHEYDIYPYISPEITHKIFQQKLSDQKPVYGKVQNGFSVVILRDISQEEANHDKSAATKLSAEIIQQRNIDLSSLYRFSLSKKYPISTNPKALEAFFDNQ